MSAPPQMSGAAPIGAPIPMPPPRRGTSPWVWILGIVGGLMVVGILVVVGFTFFVVHKVKQAGLDPELIQKNPGLAVSKMIAAANPDVDVIKTDESAGTITIRDKKTGKVVTMTFDQAKNGQFKMTATGDDGNASFEIGGGTGKLPSWVPNYPGSNAKGTFAIKGSGGDGGGEGGNFTFTTADSASKALTFYQDKAKDLGMKINVNTTTDQGGMFVASDEAEKRTLTVVVSGGSSETTVNVSYGEKK